MSALVWGAEWRRAVANTRSLFLGGLGPLVLVIVIATSGLSSVAAPMAYVGLVVAFGGVRAAVATFRDGRSGLARRLFNGGVSPAGYVLQKAGATAGVALLSLLPALGVLAILEDASAYDLLLVTVTLVLGLWVSGVLGVAIGAVAESYGELFAATGLTLLLLLHASGVFHIPGASGIGVELEAWFPFTALHEALVSVSSAGVVHGLQGAMAWAVVVAAVLAGVAGPLTARSTEVR